jgi:hypothetical protein
MTRRELLVGIAAPALLPAQDKQEKGKQVVQEAVKALGGDRFLAMRDRSESGRVYSFYRDRLTGLSRARILTRYLTRPEPPRIDFFGLRERQSFGKDKEDYAILFTEDNAYQITFHGARPLPKDSEDRYRDSTRRNILYILRQRLGEPGLIIEYEGTGVAENQPVEFVMITDSENHAVKVAFNSTTKLPVRQEYVRRDPKTRDRFEEVTRFSKYREVNGVQWPYQIQRERNGEKTFEIFSDSVQINQGLTDEQFTLSAKIKILPPAN